MEGFFIDVLEDQMINTQHLPCWIRKGKFRFSTFFTIQKVLLRWCIHPKSSFKIFQTSSYQKVSAIVCNECFFISYNRSATKMFIWWEVGKFAFLIISYYIRIKNISLFRNQQGMWLKDLEYLNLFAHIFAHLIRIVRLEKKLARWTSILNSLFLILFLMKKSCQDPAQPFPIQEKILPLLPFLLWSLFP